MTTFQEIMLWVPFLIAVVISGIIWLTDDDG